MFHVIVVIDVDDLLGPRPNPSRKTAPCRIFPTVYSTYIGNNAPHCRPFLHPQHEEEPCYGGGPTVPVLIKDII